MEKFSSIGEVKKTPDLVCCIDVMEHFSNGFEEVLLKLKISIINHLVTKPAQKIKLRNAHYLKIGVRDCRNFDKIVAKDKIEINPDPTINIMIKFYKMPSDQFFKFNKKTIAIIFIDGLHLETKVDKDIY